MKNKIIRLFSLMLLPAMLGGGMCPLGVIAADTETGEIVSELTDDTVEDVQEEEAATDFSVYGNYEQIVWIEEMDGVVPYPDSTDNIHKLTAEEAAALTEDYEGELVFTEGTYLAYVPDGKSETTITVIPENYDSKLKYKMTAINKLVDEDRSNKLIANKDGSYSLKVEGLEVICFKAVADGEKDPVPAHISGGFGAFDPQPAITDETTELVLVKGQKFVLAQKDWTSDDKKIVAISKGKVNVKKTGTTTIRRDGQTINVTVTEPSFESKKKQLYVGKQEYLGFKIPDGLEASYENPDGLRVAYISSKPEVCDVVYDGTLVPCSKGSAVISVYVNGVQYKCNVKVDDYDKSKKDFTQAVDLEPLQSVNIKLPGFKPQKAQWSSETQVSANELPKGCVFQDEVVRISKSGKLTAIAPGETLITAKGGSAEDVQILIRVNSPWTKIINMNVGQTRTVKINGVKGKIELEPDHLGIVKIDGNKITGTDPGQMLVYGKYEGFTYILLVAVEEPEIKDIPGLEGKPSSYTLTIKKGESVDITPEKCYSRLLFKSTKKEVAIVDESNVLHARGVGSTKITTKLNGKTISIKVNVTE